MKKNLLFALTMLLVLCLAACGSRDTSAEQTPPAPTQTIETPAQSETPAQPETPTVEPETSPESSNILIA